MVINNYQVNHFFSIAPRVQARLGLDLVVYFKQKFAPRVKHW